MLLMKILVALAFLAILASLVSALIYMMRSGTPRQEGEPARKGSMATALALRVGLSIVLFICVLISWKMGWIQPTAFLLAPDPLKTQQQKSALGRFFVEAGRPYIQ
jgi:NADH:ubiquinone oxidoreductase subunit 2 (subunit N)